jgi:hypothetical protein
VSFLREALGENSVKRRADRAADGVAFNHSVSLHLVDRLHGFFDVHINMARPQKLIAAINQYRHRRWWKLIDQT